MKISLFRVTDLKVFGMVGTHFLLSIFFFEKKKNNNKNILKCISNFKLHKIIFFPEEIIIILGFTNKVRKGRVTINKSTFFFIWLIRKLIIDQYKIYAPFPWFI